MRDGQQIACPPYQKAGACLRRMARNASGSKWQVAQETSPCYALFSCIHPSIHPSLLSILSFSSISPPLWTSQTIHLLSLSTLSILLGFCDTILPIQTTSDVGFSDFFFFILPVCSSAIISFFFPSSNSSTPHPHRETQFVLFSSQPTHLN